MNTVSAHRTWISITASSGKSTENQEFHGKEKRYLNVGETNGGYPDTELLPGIARYFGVTLDELFGYRGDREEQIDALLAKVNGMLAQNEYEDVNLSECLDLLREGLAEFPGDERILFALASALSRTGWMRHSEWLHYSDDGHIRSDFDRHRKNEWMWNKI